MTERKRRSNYTKPSPKREGKKGKKPKWLEDKHKTWRRPVGAVEYDLGEGA